jgi:hypothetical protein
MKRTTLALTVLTLAWLLPLGAQESARDRAREILPPQVLQGIEALAVEAARSGIPEEPLFNKALEGVAKRVPPDRILPAVTAYAGRLHEAQSAFGALSTGPLVVAGADALQRGVEAETLRRLGQRGGAEEGEDPPPTAVAVLVLADLVEAGVPADRALGVLHEAMRMRTREQQMLGIPSQVRQLMRQGQSPQQAADQVRRALQRGRGGSGGVGPPVPPGSEPVTPGRRQSGRGRGGGGGGA